MRICKKVVQKILILDSTFLTDIFFTNNEQKTKKVFKFVPSAVLCVVSGQN